MSVRPCRPAPTPFVILAGQRSGSGWLQDVLGGHPQIASYGELFLESGLGFPDAAKYGPTDIEFFESWARARSGGGRIGRARSAAPYLRRFYAPRNGERALGLKLMYSQLRRNPAAAAFIARRRVHVIHLIRTNLLDMAISADTGVARGQMHAWRGEAIADVRVSLEPRETISRLRKMEIERAAGRQFLRMFRLPTLELRYEELVDDPSGFEAAFEFLGVSPDWTPTSSMQVMNRAPKSELVENWSELSGALSSTRYSGFLTE